MPQATRPAVWRTYVLCGCELQHLASPCPQLIRTCIPLQVRKFLRTDIEGPPHHHKALLLNLACGPSIKRKESRYSLYDR
jgi:hypothetical protein